MAERTWGATELPPPRYGLGARVWVGPDAAPVPAIVVAAQWQAGVRPFVRYLVDTGAWEWQQVKERELRPATAEEAA